MSEKKIQVELPEDLARGFVDMSLSLGQSGQVRDAIAAALPPEYPEGTVAWVQSDSGDEYVCQRRFGRWQRDRWGDSPWLPEHMVRKVEPLRVLTDDEIAVKRGDIEPWHIRRDVNDGKLSPDCSVGRWLLAIADALDVEARP